MIENLKIESAEEEWVRHSFFDGNYMYSFEYELPELFETKKFTGKIQSLIKLEEKDIVELIYQKHDYNVKT